MRARLAKLGDDIGREVTSFSLICGKWNRSLPWRHVQQNARPARPDTQRLSHYLYTRLAQQYDAVIPIDDTSAVVPDAGAVRIGGEISETFPSNI